MNTPVVASGIQAGGLIDLTGIPLSQLWDLDPDDTVLRHSLRRAAAAADKKPGEPVSAFNSAI